MRNADPVFVVLDKQTLLGGYGGRVVMEGEAVRWAEKVRIVFFCCWIIFYFIVLFARGNRNERKC